jgi:hypothetical protein
VNVVTANTKYLIAGARAILAGRYAGLSARIGIQHTANKATVMPTATLNLTIVSKRMLTKREAAEHCGRPLKMFDLECSVSPVKFANGDLRWDVRDLDAWLDTLKAGIDDVDAIVDRLGQ